ncbi:MAG TPA: hypothetical protein VK454_11275 [Myxococcaceae bacterium]|nr:hypothetical protein [Myxococcaceae bacterium]
MGGINIGRLLIGGFVAGIICFFGDGIVHGVLLKEGWANVYASLGRKMADPGATHPLYYFSYDLAKAIVAVWIYAAIRPRFGAGPRTAVIAAVVAWLLVIPIPLLGLIPMEWFGRRFALAWSLYGLVPMLIAVVVGAWIYREGPAPATK